MSLIDATKMVAIDRHPDITAPSASVEGAKRNCSMAKSSTDKEGKFL